MGEVEVAIEDAEVTGAARALLAPRTDRLIACVRFQRLANVPAELEWFANLGNKSTRRAYEDALQDFMQVTGIVKPAEFRTVTRAHVIAWRDELVPAR